MVAGALAPLQGPRLAARNGAADALAVFCHGYGANGDDLIGLGQAWRDVLPGFAFASPHAPEPCPGAPGGRQWFSLASMDPAAMAHGVARAAASLDAFVDKECASLGVSPARVALVGFSQGAMLALHSGFRRAPAPMAVVGYSGAAASALGDARPPTLLVHGELDDRVPPQAMFAARAAIADAGACALWSLRPGLGHAIDETGLALGAGWLAAAAAGRLRKADAPFARPPPAPRA